ncbi:MULTISPECIES: DeoR/GlpR family DNA-binding transcription regulator [Halocynthiibacter]|uniref:DeoR/GlpR family DNA-binding transcription regulator n=1 Tax=Halocynthiibacter halioticoli TaxID=2986804 RepID=A0AAE3IZZ2_9RHOB|nr:MULTISPECIES: DeoR/GlpR family DNA-binding transcription regulator [Halocynthiibacter]MCV6824003.1 DeoR/GlpR family DNA-binding transcription regulator [Halocynthiibacter halioticoli]MCW4057004.1 DeoR/GlpR family DNA-binding transcription regulator [Halocynthiibacter sp. SDUM655004]MDE0589970.1 DeoR/GlpR family DNA-binding transcription regulator [Halocynthiibacter sp. C4]
MAHNFREPDILEIARKEGKVTVEDLAARFGVTVQTIRRDLSDLADEGKLERVHGGAVLPSGVANIGYEDRRGLNDQAKEAIARRCAAEIPEGASLFLNIGTSTEAVARALLHHKNIMVVTNNLNVGNILAANADCQVVIAGGMLRRSDGGLVGDLTIEAVQQFKVDFAVISCSGVDGDGDLLDFDVLEVGVSKTIVRQSRKTFLVADHSKFQRTAPAKIASLKEIDALITDQPVAPEFVEKCRAWDTRVLLADSD